MHTAVARRAGGLFSVIFLVLSTGCFREEAFPLRPGDVAVLHAPEPMAPRPWLRHAHEDLKHLLPRSRSSALVTEDLLASNGQPVNVPEHFHLDPGKLDQLFYNYQGLKCTAEATGQNQSLGMERIDWTGYDETWVPVHPGLSLCGQMGWAKKDGQVLDADCIVILPGLLGHNNILRTKDLADGLRERGFHVLPIELRGHGRTDERYPDIYYNFSVLETGDLMAISEWLQQQPHIRRTGLVGFCWGANHGLLAAWDDARAIDHPNISPRLATHLRPLTEVRHFQAGVIAFSPVLRFEDIIESTKEPQSKWRHPVLAGLQETIHDRMIYKHHSEPSGSLRTLIDHEFARSELSYPGAVEDGLDYLRLLPFRGREDGHKLTDVRIPVLIVHGANDPLTPSQAVADLIARTPNPNVAAEVLPGGGHVGFGVYARAYYFSLMVNFFDPRTGPVAVDRGENVPPSNTVNNQPRHVSSVAE